VGGERRCTAVLLASVVLFSVNCPPLTFRIFSLIFTALNQLQFQLLLLLLPVAPALACQGRRPQRRKPSLSSKLLPSRHPITNSRYSQNCGPPQLPQIENLTKTPENHLKPSSSGLGQFASHKPLVERPLTRSISFNLPPQGDRGSSAPVCSFVWAVYQLLYRLHLFVASRHVA
jgi:hypothetical protein